MSKKSQERKRAKELKKQQRLEKKAAKGNKAVVMEKISTTIKTGRTIRNVFLGIGAIFTILGAIGLVAFIVFLGKATSG